MGRHCELFTQGSSDEQKLRTLLALQKRWRTDAAIGQQNGVTRQAVHQWRERLGVPALMEKHDRRNAEICKAYQAGHKVPELVKKWRVSVSQVYRIIRAANDM